MTKSKRGRYTLEFKQEAARLVESGQSQAAAARSLGVVEQTLGNWVREHRAGTLKGASSKPAVTAEQMENSRLRAELARVTMERDILGKGVPRTSKEDAVFEMEVGPPCSAYRSGSQTDRKSTRLNSSHAN